LPIDAALHPELRRDQARNPQLVTIPEGWFLMGSDSGRDDEQPAHRVWVDGFGLAAYQVRNCVYAEFLRATQHALPPLWNEPGFSDPEQPVVSVSWFDAVAYCEWLTRETGRKYRLPSEAEWERAARGTIEGTAFPWGDEPPDTRPDYASRWKTGPEPVGRHEPNSFGLYDICENVHEWCSDRYAADYYRNSPDCNPHGPSQGTRRSSRGGSWRHHIKIARCSARSSIPPEFKYADYGFRVACSLR
jgi:formylglycine-generating enzyme